MFKHITFTLAALALLSACSVKDDRLAGLATVNTGFSNTVNISTAVGAPTTSSSAIFLATDEQTMNVSIDALDAEGATLYHKEVRNVPFQRNRCTRLTGSIYSATTPASTVFQLNTAWLDNNEMDF